MKWSFKRLDIPPPPVMVASLKTLEFFKDNLKKLKIKKDNQSLPLLFDVLFVTATSHSLKLDLIFMIN